MDEAIDQPSLDGEQSKDGNTWRDEGTRSLGDGKRGLSIGRLGTIAVALVVVLTVFTLVLVQGVIEVNRRTVKDDQDYYSCSEAIVSLREASDYLTSQSRMYVMTGDSYYLDSYIDEVVESDRRGEAIRTLKQYLDEGDQTLPLLVDALSQSNELAKTETYALSLAADAYGLPIVPEYLAGVELTEADAGLSRDEKLAKATDLVLNNSYDRLKSKIIEDVERGTSDLIDLLQDKREASMSLLDTLLVGLRVTNGVTLAIVIMAAIVIYRLMLKPLATYERSIRKELPLEVQGGRELRYLADAYNAMYEENLVRTELLQHAAEHDPLTGLRNRGAYDALLDEHAGKPLALVLIDIDRFKEFNDLYGHEVGDAVLCRVASAIEGSVRSTDYPCRIGGDEFAVIMCGLSNDLRHVIEGRIQAMRGLLATEADGLPAVTLSIGVAFGHLGEEGQRVFREADAALYLVKQRGRNGYAFYGQE